MRLFFYGLVPVSSSSFAALHSYLPANTLPQQEFEGSLIFGPITAGLRLKVVALDVRLPIYLSTLILNFPLDTCLGADLELTALQLQVWAFVDLEVCIFGKCIGVSNGDAGLARAEC